MRRIIFGGVSVILSLIALAAAARAADHLKCYKVKDPLSLKGPKPSWLDLSGEFPTESCSIVGGFRLFCVPVTKTVTGQLQRKFSPPGGAFQDFTPAPVAGQDLTEDTLCYQIKCTDKAPSPPNPSLQVFDQFGCRTVTKLQPYLLCGPAGQGQAPASTTFNVPLDGSQAGTNSTATGSCTIVLNGAQTTLTIDCTHNVANTILAHIHKGGVGVAGPIVFPFSSPASPIHEVWNLTPSDVTDLLAGSLYVNIHSMAFIGGEIRGQIQ
jgi:hypothetical protein